MKITERYINEDLPEHWNVDESKESFSRLINHISLTTNFKSFFERELSYPPLLKAPKNSLVVADIGSGVGWTTSIIASMPEVKKVYSVEPSEKRLSRVPFVAKHFNVPEDKIILVNGNFENLNIPEKINLAIFSSSFHHCFDNQMPILFENLKKILQKESVFEYKDYHNLNKKIVYKGKVLLASEHYVNWMWTARKIQLYYKNIFNRYFKSINENKEDIKFGQWRSPNKFSGEHHRTKKEIEKIVRDAGFKYNIIKHSGHSCIGDRWNIESLSVKYYFAMLSLL